MKRSTAARSQIGPDLSSTTGRGKLGLRARADACWRVTPSSSATSETPTILGKRGEAVLALQLRHGLQLHLDHGPRGEPHALRGLPKHPEGFADGRDRVLGGNAEASAVAAPVASTAGDRGVLVEHVQQVPDPALELGHPRVATSGSMTSERSSQQCLNAVTSANAPRDVKVGQPAGRHELQRDRRRTRAAAVGVGALQHPDGVEDLAGRQAGRQPQGGEDVGRSSTRRRSGPP